MEYSIQNISPEILSLLIKNVSPDTPLLPDELQTLRSFKSTISDEDWKEWLKVARREKKRRNQLQNQNQTQEKEVQDSSQIANTKNTSNTVCPTTSLPRPPPPPPIHQEKVFYDNEEKNYEERNKDSNFKISSSLSTYNQTQNTHDNDRYHPSHEIYKLAIGEPVLNDSLRHSHSGNLLASPIGKLSLNSPADNTSARFSPSKSPENNLNISNNSSISPQSLRFESKENQNNNINAGVSFSKVSSRPSSTPRPPRPVAPSVLPHQTPQPPQTLPRTFSFNDISDRSTSLASSSNQNLNQNSGYKVTTPSASTSNANSNNFDYQKNSIPINDFTSSSHQYTQKDTTNFTNYINDTNQHAKTASNRLDLAYSAAKFLLQNSNLTTEEASKQLLEDIMSTLQKANSNFEKIDQNTTKLMTNNELDHDNYINNKFNSTLRSNVRYNNSSSYDDENYESGYGNNQFSSSISQFNSPMGFKSSISKKMEQYDISNNIINNNNNNNFKDVNTYMRTNELMSPLAMNSPISLSKSQNNNNPSSLLYSSVNSNGNYNDMSFDNHLPGGVGYQEDPLLYSDSNYEPPLYDRNQKLIKEKKQLSLITRICIAQGPLVKAFEEFPIRVDLENSSVDVVWREKRLIKDFSSTKNSVKSLKSRNSISNNDINSILRRERFSFDYLFAGNKSNIKLSSLVCSKTRDALVLNSSLVFIITGCGEVNPGELEPPASLVLGNGGGTGLACTFLTELFSLMSCDSKSSNLPLNLNDDDSINFRESIHFQNSTIKKLLLKEPQNFSISMSSLLISGTKITDLLSNSSNTNNIQIKKTAGGSSTIVGATSIELSSVMDYERVIGLILGRRSGITESFNLFQSLGININQNSFNNLYPYASWNNATTSQSSSNSIGITIHDNYFENLEDNSRSSIMFLEFTLTVGRNNSNNNISTNRSYQLNYRFVFPCGSNWRQPGYDLNLLAESISCLPHVPPPNVINVSPLTMLLTDPSHKPCSYVSIVAVNRSDKSKPRKPEEDFELASNSLTSLRIACIPK